MQTGRLIGAGATAEIYTYGDGCILKLCRKSMPEAMALQEFTASTAVTGSGK